MKYYYYLVLLIMAVSLFMIGCDTATPPPFLAVNGTVIYNNTFTTIINNITIINGTQGPQGIPGINGINGTNGINGADGSSGHDGTDGHDGTSVFMDSITDFFNGTFTWHFTDGFNFTTSNLKGPAGASGNGTIYDKGNETIIDLMNCDGTCTTIIEVEYI